MFIISHWGNKLKPQWNIIVCPLSTAQMEDGGNVGLWQRCRATLPLVHCYGEHKVKQFVEVVKFLPGCQYVIQQLYF